MQFANIRTNGDPIFSPIYPLYIPCGCDPTTVRPKTQQNITRTSIAAVCKRHNFDRNDFFMLPFQIARLFIWKRQLSAEVYVGRKVFFIIIIICATTDNRCVRGDRRLVKFVVSIGNTIYFKYIYICIVFSVRNTIETSSFMQTRLDGWAGGGLNSENIA